MRIAVPFPPLSPNGQARIRRVILTGFIVGMLWGVDVIARDAGEVLVAQAERPSTAAAKAASEPNANGENRKPPKKEKIRTRSIQPGKTGPETPGPMEKAPSIDADAQKGLVDRMKGCCDTPKN